MSDLLQIGKGTSVTVTVAFEYNGTGQDLDSGVPTVTLTRPDGTAGPAAGTITDLAAAGQYSFVVAGQPQVTWLDYTAVGTVGNQPQTLRGRVEWVGQPLFNLSRFRALRVAGGTPFALTATPLYSDRQIMDARTAVLQEFTDILGFSPVQRLARETLDAGGGNLLLRHQPAGPLVSVTVGGVAQLVTGYSVSAGALRSVSGAGIPAGLANVVVEYVHGTERPPGKGGDMAMMYASAMLIPSLFSSAVSASTADGATYSYEPSEVGRGGYQRWTGIRDVDRWLNMHRAVAGVA